MNLKDKLEIMVKEKEGAQCQYSEKEFSELSESVGRLKEMLRQAKEQSDKSLKECKKKEKDNLIDLTNKLKVSQESNISFQKSIEKLNTEITSMKGIYEKKIENLSLEIEILTEENNRFVQDANEIIERLSKPFNVFPRKGRLFIKKLNCNLMEEK